jgi:hypothetical protein
MVKIVVGTLGCCTSILFERASLQFFGATEICFLFNLNEVQQIG